MRKQTYLLFSILLIAILPDCKAQWQLTGNSNASNTSILGTTNSIPLRLATKNTTRMTLDTLGRVGIGTSAPVNILTVKGAGSNPVSSWANTGAPLFAGFGETTVGNADFILGMGAAASNARPVFVGRKSRGTLAAPAVVANNDFLMTFLASGYDGASFINPAGIDFYVDGTPTAGNVPARISFVTGSNSANRAERLKIGNTGDISFNGTQLTLTRASGDVSIGSGNLSVAKNSNFKGLVGINGDTLTGTALYVNANGTTSGIRIKDPQNNLALTTEKTGNDAAVYIIKSSKVSTTGCIIGEAKGSSTGVEGYSTTNYGVYGQSDSSVAIAGVGTADIGILGESQNPLSYAGYFNGDVFASGTYTSSDERLKSNIADFGGALHIIKSLQPKNYNFKSEGTYAALHLPAGKHYGLLAQDVEKVLPGLVKETQLKTFGYKKGIREESRLNRNDKVSFKAVNYTELIPIMVKGMQELSNENEALKHDNTKLKNKIDELQQETNSAIAGLQKQLAELMAVVNAKDGNFSKSSPGVIAEKAPDFILEQNVPNPPVQHTTKIFYTLPAESTNAAIVLSDVSGKVIGQYKLSNGRKGYLTINTAGIAPGTYPYTLYSNGKRIATKQLIVNAE